MSSPFPGMDPYIEDPFFWPDFHGSMNGIIRGALNAVLPSRYSASMDRHVWVQQRDAGATSLLGGPDVQVADRAGRTNGAPATATTAVPAVAPFTVVLPLVRRQGPRYLRIVDRHRRRIVTVIELLSPSNKTSGEDGLAYRDKRNDYLGSNVNLVEIDLLRLGERPPLQEPPPAPSDYYILISTVAEFPRSSFWPLMVRDRLPTIPVPLDPGEEPVSLDLRACLDRAYDDGRYASELDYSRPPVPPLREADVAWARELLAQRSS